MCTNEDVSAGKNGEKELTREDARELRKYYLALAEKNTTLEDEIDSADSTMATLILPGD